MVTEQDVRNLITKYHQDGVCAIATQIPMSDRNMEILSHLSKYIGSFAKRWRGSNWNGSDCPRKNAERVSIYPKDVKRAEVWFYGRKEEEEIVLTDQQKICEEMVRANRYRGQAVYARTLMLNRMNTSVHGYVILDNETFNLVCNALSKVN